MSTTIQFLGATRTVTGSCFLIRHGSSQILIDCGLAQGPPDLTARNRLPFAFDPRALDAVILTHAHLDHTGLTPRLLAEGFRKRIVTTPVTRELLPVLWDDFLRLQTDHGKPLYTESDVDQALNRTDGRAYDTIIPVAPGIRARLNDAGHILGSAIVELWLEENGRTIKIVFSGDLGHRGKPIVRDPATIRDADVLVLESTYGDRNHKSMAETLQELGQVMAETLREGGTVLMPVYAIGRSQEVLYVINRLTMEGVLDRPHVFLDSPMAIRAAEVYGRHVEAFDEEARLLVQFPPRNPHAPKVRFTETVAASKAIARAGSCIVLAGSGMCEGGRIQEHLVRCLSDSRSCIIFTGFQVTGTLGRRLVDGAAQVKILGRMVPVKARIHTINGLSAHADQAGLLEWVAAFDPPRPRTFLVHGESEKMTALALALDRRHGIKAVAPEWKDMVRLDGDQAW